MYLLSKFIKSKYKIPLLIVSFFILYLISTGLLRIVFISFSRNLILSDSYYLKELNKLKAKRLQLSQELERMSGLKEENERFRKILKFKEGKEIDLVASRVIAIEPSRFRRVILTSRGQDAALEEGMFVVDENGYLVGKLLRIHADYSEVALVNDPDFTATVRIGDSLGLLKGTLAGAVKVFYVEHKTDVSNGDLVWAEPHSFNFGFYVGRVERIKENKNSLFLDITVKSVSCPYSLNTVFVVK